MAKPDKVIEKKKAVSKSTKAGLTFPVSRVTSRLKKNYTNWRVGGTAPIYMAAILQYICSDILLLASNHTLRIKKNRITPQTVMRVIRTDDQLMRVLGDTSVFVTDALKDVGKRVSLPKPKAV